MVVIANETNPIHTYQNEGTYAVTLTIYNIAGKSDSVQKEIFNVTITNPANGLYFLENQVLDTKKTSIFGAITAEATLSSFGELGTNVDYVEFFVDNVSRMTVNEMPFKWK